MPPVLKDGTSFTLKLKRKVLFLPLPVFLPLLIFFEKLLIDSIHLQPEMSRSAQGTSSAADKEVELQEAIRDAQKGTAGRVLLRSDDAATKKMLEF